MKQKFIDFFMSVADLTAKLSYAKRLKVGAVIVKGDQILATGYNGMPSGWENVCENVVFNHWPHDDTFVDQVTSETITKEMIEEMYPHADETGRRYTLKSKPEVMHAERNALDKVAASTESTVDSVMFCTHAPCLECAKSIYKTGISAVYYKHNYRSDAGITFLKNTGVPVHQYRSEL